MGRLPATWGGKLITARAPWALYGEVALISAQIGVQVADSTYLNSTDRPFEIHRMIPFCIALDVNGVAISPQPDQDLLSALIKTKITDLGKGPNTLMKVSTRIRALVKGSSERTWEWADPYYLAKGEQLSVVHDAFTFPTITSLVSIMVGMNFEGFFITVGPPAETR